MGEIQMYTYNTAMNKKNKTYCLKVHLRYVLAVLPGWKLLSDKTTILYSLESTESI